MAVRCNQRHRSLHALVDFMFKCRFTPCGHFVKCLYVAGEKVFTGSLLTATRTHPDQLMKEVVVFATAARSIDEALGAVVTFRPAPSTQSHVPGGGRAVAGLDGGAGAGGPSKLDTTVVESVILHGNDIQSLDCKLPLSQLMHLNLSSNAITVLDGSLLGRFPRLATLDLSSNRVCKVEGLGALTSLVSLRLAGNVLSSLDWLDAFHGPRHRLQTLDVSGNQVVCECGFRLSIFSKFCLS